MEPPRQSRKEFVVARPVWIRTFSPPLLSDVNPSVPRLRGAPPQIPEQTIARIRRDLEKTSLSFAAIGRAYGVSGQYVGQIARGVARRHPRGDA